MTDDERGEDIMTAKGIYYVLAYVSDLDRSKRFYRETLGWKLGTDEKVVAGFAFGNAYVVLHQDDRPGERRYQGGMHVSVQVEDVDAEHTRLSKLGAAVSDLRDFPWGERSFSLDDPDGYTWSFGQPKR
jgi:catechol 2,3-dioxygenase-like lactoylglutathione lyase family enzyme